MTAQPPYDPNAYRPTRYLQTPRPSTFRKVAPSRVESCSTRRPSTPKILRLQEIMIVSALLCFVHGIISSFAPDNLSPWKGLPEFGVAGGLGLLIGSAIVYSWVYFTIQKGKRQGLTVGPLLRDSRRLRRGPLALIGNVIDAQRYGFVPLYAAWFIANVLWIRSPSTPRSRKRWLNPRPLRGPVRQICRRGGART